MKTEENSVKRWYARRQWLKFEKFERWAFAHALWTVAVGRPASDGLCGALAQ